MNNSVAQKIAGTNPARAGVWPAYRALVGTGIACACLIVAMFYLTQPIIEAKRQAQLEAAIFKVLPGTTRKRDFVLTRDGQLFPSDSGLDTEKAGGQTLYAGFDAAGHVTGVAIRAQGMGYQDTIRLLYGYKPSSQTISGIQILDSKETPGLGDKIEKDPAFVANFDNLDASLAENRRELANAIVAVKNGEKNDPWQIDGITGATISSDAIASILHTSTSSILPNLYPQRARLKDLYDKTNDTDTGSPGKGASTP